MKKKVILIIMVVVVAALGVLGLTACDSYTANDSGIIFRMVDKRYVVYGIEGSSTETEIVIPDRFENIEVAGIAREAFKDNSKITKVTISDGVKSIASSAFENCTALESVIMADSVTLLGTYIFKGCTALTSVTLPETLTVLSGGMFYGCTALTTITLPESTTKISDSAFVSTGLTSVSLPNKITEIGESAFSSCADLVSVTLSNTLFSLGICAFTKCTSLTSITIPQSVGIINEWVFSESGLVNATFVDTSSWRVAPHNFKPNENNADQVISLSADDLANSEIAATYLVKNSNMFDASDGGYSNYVWYKN